MGDGSWVFSVLSVHAWHGVHPQKVTSGPTGRILWALEASLLPGGFSPVGMQIMEIMEITEITEIMEIMGITDDMDDNFDLVCVSLAFQILYSIGSRFNVFSP